MKLIQKPIAMIASFEVDGTPTPVKFKYFDNTGEEKIIKIDTVLKREIQKFMGSGAIMFKCQSIINGEPVLYEIKYEFSTCRWILYKI